MGVQIGGLQRVLSVLGVTLVSGVLLTGCGTTGSLMNSPQALVVPAMQGKMFGGQQPVAGATIQLWAVGLPTTGGSYGGGQASLLTSAVTTDANGGFKIDNLYTCPDSSYVYITGTGGSPTSSGVNNSALALMAALGPCGSLTTSTFINMNEATTVAGVWALQQFATASYGTAGSFSVGAPSSNATGLKNAFAAVNNIANTTTGAIPLITASTRTINGTSVTVNTQNEQSKVGTLANILAACVNTTDAPVGTPSSVCTSLFNSVKPAGRTLAAADTIQAALDMAQNPTNVGTTSTPPFNLTTAVAPFQPSLTTPPTDYTLGLAYGSTAVLGATGAQTYFLYGPLVVNVDSVGNIYSLNGPGGTIVSPYNGVSVISPAGAPVADFYGGTLLNQPRGMALDTNDNIWIVNQATTTPANAVVELTQSGGSNSFTYASGLYGIAIDGNNNVFVGSNSGQQLLQLTGGTGTLHGLGAVTGPETIAIDQSLNLWSVGFSVTSVTKFNATACTTSCTYATRTSFTGASSPFSIAIDQSGIPWATETAANAVLKLDPTQPTSGGSTTVAKLGGLNNPQYTAMDGASNVWVANNSPASVTELAAGSTTTALSPSGGFTHTFNGPKGIAVDMSGNVWVTNNSATNASGSYGLTEIVGAGVPAVQPLSRAVLQGKIGQRP